MKKLIKKPIIRLYQIVGRWYLGPVLIHDWKKSCYKFVNERTIEFGFAFKWLSKICPGEVLDVGSGTTAWPHLMANCGFRVTAIDKIKGYWKGDFFNRHYHIVNDDITETKLTRQFDFISCISVLEHIPDHQKAVDSMFKLLKPGGHLLVTVPYNEKQYIANVYQLPQAGYGQHEPYICQVFSRKEIDRWLGDNRGEIVDQDYYQVFSGDFWTFGKRIYPPRRVKKEARHQLSCLIIRKTPETE